MEDIVAISTDAAWWSSVDHWALVIVAVGVVVEGISEWLPKERRENKLIVALTRTGWMLLVLALVGEWVAQHNKDADDALIIASLSENAGKLGVTIDNLHAFVEQKEAEADKQRRNFRTYANAQKRQNDALISELKDDETRLSKARDDAQAAATQAEDELEAMQAASTPRSLTDTQQDDFVLRLKAFAPLTVNIFSLPSTTPDAGPLADLLVALLKKANWNVGFGTPASGWAKTVLVCVGTNPPLNITSAATAIVETLRQDGIMAFINEKLGPTILLTGFGSPVKNPDMTIIVGSKQ